MGVSFDCASKREIEAVLSLDVSPSRIVYAHPYKPVSSLNYAKLKNVSLMTFDTSIELYKIKDVYPSAKLLLRLLPEIEFDARIQFGSRFGCPLSEVKKVLRLAYDLNLNIVGVSFHVGSDVKDPEAYISVLSQSRDVFDIAEEIGFNMTILDIGGGFPGDHNTSRQFTKFAEVINKTVLDLFPPDNNLEIIAEPGRYIVASAFTVVANIIGKRCYKKSIAGNETDDNDEIQTASNAKVSTTYFINDSVFGNFVFGHLYKPGSEIYTPKLVKHFVYLDC
ncbi:ornithine decarboxylase-like [Ruditapes philippinarum]|uniref:ornithine decarboxylase-like n=1 Tax=Ruditapes philippinarum TaxID=129788 RepID=UPI00295A8B93|nr:ornithine decarboxylase-like [Ruditapes philippinarum]